MLRCLAFLSLLALVLVANPSVSNAASPDGSILQPGTSGSLTTSAGTWTFSAASNSGGNLILLNGVQVGGGSGVKLQIANGGKLYVLNAVGKWYVWNGSGYTVTTAPTGPTNGQCGSANNSSFASAPTTNLCTAGTTSPVAGAGPWTWSCAGTNGGTTQSCSAAKTVTISPDGSVLLPGSGGNLRTGAGTWTFSASANSGGNLILLNGVQVGGGSGVKLQIANGGQLYVLNAVGKWYVWTGSGYAATTAPTGATNGQCGTSNGQKSPTAPTTNLCTAGTTSSVAGTGPWSWSCAGIGGGTTASCSANIAIAVNGSCGTSNGKSLSAAPTTNLCIAGTASTIAGTGPWIWNCAGANGGTTQQCSASLLSSQINGTCGPTNGTVATAPPTSGLCNAGTASTVAGGSSSNIWQWSCIGANGGTTASCTTVATASWWIPALGSEWQWELDHPLNTSSASDMGIGIKAFNGATAPATNPVIYDIDGFDNPASTVAALHAIGARAVCYIEVGAAENYRSDYSLFPAAALGNSVEGYSNERYLDIRNPTVVSIIKARILMCANKGFDGIEPDLDESYRSNTGFPLTKANEIAYMTTLANYAHSLHLAMFGKNIDDTDDSYAADMFPVFDAVLTEQCNQYSTCSALNAYTGKKAVFNAEYSGSTSSFCPADNARPGWNGVLFPVSLNGARAPCR